MGTTTFTVVIWTILGLNPQDDVVRDDVDLVEINHYYDEQGKRILDQLIFYDWCPLDCRYQVRAWRLIKNSSQIPHRDWRTGEFSATWHDGDVLRQVRAKAMRETWTQYDPELVEREYLAKDKRRDLRKVSPLKLDSPALVVPASATESIPRDSAASRGRAVAP